MSAESSKRSNLIDETFQHIHTVLSGHLEGTTVDQLSETLKPRVEQLKSVAEPFGKPSDASKKKVNSGSVTLRDGVVLRVEDADKEFVFAISKNFDIDEVEALVLLRSFLYNEGLPAEPSDPVYEIANEILPLAVPDGNAFADSLLAVYVHKMQAKLPERVAASADPKRASAWAKQNAKEQLVLLEVLFWTMWSYAACDGPLVVRIYETAFDTNLGSEQQNVTLLLDEEGAQLQQDSAALWILLTIEVLELERAAQPGGVSIYWASPESLKRIHELVVSHNASYFACIYLAWAFLLSRLTQAALEMKELPHVYSAFFESLVPPADRSYSKDREPAHVQMTKTCWNPVSPLLVTAVAWRTGSTLTDPNAVAYRSVLKGLFIAIVELMPVELIPDFDSLVEVWIALFGRSESQSVVGICTQYWTADWSSGIARRAIFDVARSRFPVQFRPLIRLLRAMTATGFLDTDPLSTVDHANEGSEVNEERELCTRHVFYYLQKLPTFTQVIPVSSCTGAHALYEKLPDRHGSSTVVPGLVYANTRSIKLPGGTTLPARSIGRLLSGDGGDLIVVSWQHEHSGWKLLLELLTDHVNRRRMQTGGYYQNVSFGARGANQPLALRMEDIGVEMDSGDENTVVDVLDLIRSVVQDNPVLAEELLDSLEGEAQPPDLVQLTTMILEEALSRHTNQPRNPLRTPLITSAMSVLSALCAAQIFNRVWLYIRSTASLFGSERSIGVASAVLAAERITGHYTMTLALLHLVQQLFDEASSSVLAVLQQNPRLQQVKEEVLLRAARFVHAEIWVEHTSWKYAQLGDRFEIGRRVSAFYAEVYKHSPPTLDNGPFSTLSRAISDAFLSKATTSTVNPLVSSLTSAGSVLELLYAARRYGDARRLVLLLESHLILTRVILNHKERVVTSSQPCLLEQVLCTRVTTSAAFDGGPSKTDPVDALAAYVKERSMGPSVPVEAMRVLFALCSSLSSSQGSTPTIIGHLSDPEATVTSLVRIIQHPYDDALLRNAVWNFITLAVDKEPALARLFVTGRSASAKGKEREVDESTTSKSPSAFTVACNMLENWKDLWEPNPQLLASLHKASLEDIRDHSGFFDQLAEIVSEELGPSPDYKTESFVVYDGAQHSNLHEAVLTHAYRTIVKAHAVHIISADIRFHTRQDHPTSSETPPSYRAIERIFLSEDEMMELVGEAASSFPTLRTEQLQLQEPLAERDYGDDFAFSTKLLQFRLHFEANHIHKPELSLAHVQTTLTESWQELLLQVVPRLRGKMSVRSILMALAASISGDLSVEKRAGDMVSTIHRARLSLLLALLEVAWFSTSDTENEVNSFVELVRNVRGIILNLPAPFHRYLLQIIYFCARHSRSLTQHSKLLSADRRLSITSMLEAAIGLVIDHLRTTMDSACFKLDVELDQDLELLVAVFEQCTRRDLGLSSTFWLSRFQETDVVRTSLQLFSCMDIVGVSDVSLLRARKQPLYTPHVLAFHLALASVPSAAERLASEGVLTAYGGNSISTAIGAGMIDTVLPELPGERSPAHRAYCTMLAIVAGVITSLGRHGQYMDSEACGLIQLYGDQIHRALSWTINEALTLALLEEIEQVVNLFSAIAQTSAASIPNTAIQRVLRFFSTDALLLLQQLNYALTHPNHLASLVEPITADEKTKFEADSGDSSLDSPAEIVNPSKRPFLARLVYRLFRLSSNILSCLTIVSRAETVLVGEREDWLVHEALIVPHSKVVLGEPASIGTLLELGNRSLDILRHLTERPPTQALTRTSGSEKILDVRDSARVTRRNLEAALLYAITQLAMWLSKPEFDASSNERENDDMVTDNHSPEPLKERRVARRRTSMTLAERLRRGMTGEMAADLQSLLGKARPVIAKSDTVLGSNDVDLTQVLSHFVSERISVPS
ncbi:nucleoporin subcomplex protein binding to Pom34-domain-containing protein [Amylocystis lapponica]|nr:nucleoporin subcomplex protein binding to Pom34-domain-containing protein [Amylocystis lapponica]